MQREPELVPWNRSHPHLTGTGSPITPIRCLPHRVLLHPWHLHPAAQLGLTRSSRPPQHTVADSPCSPSAFHSLLPSLRGARHVPAAASTLSPGGAERGGAGRSLRLRQARAQHRAPPRSQRVSRRPGCQKQSRGGLARGAKATGEARRAAEGLPGSVARDGGNRARCGSSLRAGSWSAGLVGCMCGVSSTPSQRTV